MKACGIDLGTTNSCIVVVDQKGNRIIESNDGSRVFPSVVYMGKKGDVVVGQAAKNRMGELPQPVAAVKRKMGSTEKVLLGGKARTPVEVSAMILSYLKQLAEARIGEIVDRAVVTVPAYFSHIQRQHTDEAARRADFREVVTLLEPVAAALFYSLQSARERMRVFVYDLGGGTFDATVLEKDAEGGLTVLSFGGDPFLGGDDIDARLVRFILDRLQKQGYRLDLDLAKPEDYSRFQRLKFYAELAKVQLTDQVEVPLVRQGLFRDQEGNLVDLDIMLTRRDLEECSGDLIGRTIAASMATLEKADRKIPIDSIDEIIMVGGMSRMPMVAERLAREFGKTPKLVDPDLSVALGAAVKAAEVFHERLQASSGIRLDLHFDRRTDQRRTRVSGLFDRKICKHTVFLTAAQDDLELFQVMDGKDRFNFEHVPLAAETINRFHVSLEDAEENIVLQQDIEIVHDSKTVPILSSPGSVVTKAIAVGTVDGVQVLFAENTPLPYTVRQEFQTTDNSGRIVAPILEAENEIERFDIRDIPTTLPAGSRVQVEITIRSDYHIEAKASVPELGREVKIDFDISPVDTSGINREYVRRRLAQLEQDKEAAVDQCPSREKSEVVKFRFDVLRDEIEAELREIEPKPAKLREKLTGMEFLIERLPQKSAEVVLKPSHEDFIRLLSGIVTHAMETQHPKLAELRPGIDRLRKAALDAWTGRDEAAWSRANKELVDLYSALITAKERAEDFYFMIVEDLVTKMKSAAKGKHNAEIEGIKEAATAVFLNLQAGVLKPEEAITDLVRIHRSRVVPLSRELGLNEQQVSEAPSSIPKRIGGLRIAKF
jgi:molecular chaperone DnaK (HSP70)